MSAVLELPPASTNPHFANGATTQAQQPEIHRFTAQEYELMITHGIFTENDRIELLNGLLIDNMPKGKRHATLNDLIASQLSNKLDARACIRNQNPVALDDFSEPEPDIVVAEPPLTKYFDHHPAPAEIYLIAEISDTTLAFDREAKGAAYARAGIAQYLIFNLSGRCVEDYREPDSDGYRSKQTYAEGQSFNLVAFPDIALNVNDLLPLPPKE